MCRRAPLAFLLAALVATACSSRAPERRLSRATLADKVRGGWAGQMVGVSFGAPTEFKSEGKIFEGTLAWTPDRVENAIHQDDLYVEMTFAEVMDRRGLDATTAEYGEMFRDSRYDLWHANAGARRNLSRGIEAPRSGQPKYNMHANDIDFQIESDFIGLMCPGLPREVNRYADRVGRVMNYGDGLYGGMFMGGLYAAAFFESDPRRVVEEGLKSIPAESSYAHVIRDVLAWHAAHPDDWRATWKLLEAKWDRDDVCPDGALAPFNIDARINGAYVVLGLLYGGGDFAKTLEVATRSGQDSDCNPSSAAGVLGVILGYERIPDAYRSGIPAVADTRFEFTRYSLNEIVASTLARAEKVVTRAGGRVSPTEVTIPLQAPEAPALEEWNSGVPVARVTPDDGAWKWSGHWKTRTLKNEWSEWKVREAGGAGDEATFTFEGTGVALVGTMSQEGGRADVWVDGVEADPGIDAWIPERTNDDDYWHVTGLAPGTHRVRLVVRGDADERSKGRKVQIETAIVYAEAAPPR
jgi:ADP-ribosylglycohydrolase